jgi:hypothetical protein
VLQLTSPEIQPKFYGFARPKPVLIAWRNTGTALALSRLDHAPGGRRTGGRSLFGRIGLRPFTWANEAVLSASGRNRWTMINETRCGIRAGARPLDAPKQ